jgi:hypothetical protein
LPAAFREHCFAAFSKRWREMDDDLARLAFFLDPRYKAAVTVDMEALCVTVSTWHFVAGAATALSQPDLSLL